MDVFVKLDSWLSAAIFSGLMVAAWVAGDRVRRRGDPPTGEVPPPPRSTRVEDATLALFGLLLAFCFAGASTRYEARKQVLVDDAMAIAGLATVADLLEEPERGALRQELLT